MTSFASDKAWGEPVELFLFTIGTVEYRYCDVDREVTDPATGKVYKPIPIDRGRVSSAANLDKTELKVVVPLDSEIAEVFRTFPPGFKVSLKIFGGNLGENAPAFSAVWAGRVLQGSRERVSGGVEQCVLSCEPASTTMRQSGLRRNWQLSCPHALYGASCRASEAAAAHVATITDLGSIWLEVASGWEGASAKQKFKAGKVTWPGQFSGLEQRMILSVSGDTLQLAGPTTGLSVGDNVTIYLGCNRLMSDCRNLHNNIVNFGGQPWIPVENPIGRSQI